MQFSADGFKEGTAAQMNQANHPFAASHHDHVAGIEIDLSLAVGGQSRFNFLTDDFDRDNGVETDNDGTV